jgi:hypothetical protein
MRSCCGRRVGKIERAGVSAWARRVLDFAHPDESSSAPLPTLQFADEVIE